MIREIDNRIEKIEAENKQIRIELDRLKDTVVEMLRIAGNRSG